MPDRLRVAVVGDGIAGTTLAWRLSDRRCPSVVDLYTGPERSVSSATAASGGLTRGFATDPAAAVIASDSLAELLASPRLRRWAGYRQAGSVYLLPDGAALAAAALVEQRIERSVSVLTRTELLARFPFRRLPPGTVGVVERRAGTIDPALLRSALLGALPTERVTVHRGGVATVGPDATVLPRNGRERRYDAVVLATGAWTPGLLTTCALPADALRTKSIQYLVCRTAVPGLGSFVDDTSGLFGRPIGTNRFLFGLPDERWGVEPESVRPDPALTERTIAIARHRLGPTAPAGRVDRVVAVPDCYHQPAGLALRAVRGAAGLFTFTGGSGGAAKAVLATSRTAAAALITGDHFHRTDGSAPALRTHFAAAAPVRAR